MFHTHDREEDEMIARVQADASAAEITRLRAELATAREETIAWRSAFQRVTPGGSEFTSPKAVREWADTLKMDVFNANKAAVLTKRDLAAANERAALVEIDGGKQQHRAEIAEAALSASQEREKALRVALDAEREACAKVVEDNQILHTSDGDVLKPRWDGNRSGLVYAMAIRARALTQEAGE